MAKKLVIVESPAKAKTISKYLGDGYLIKASYGHVRDLPTYTLGVNPKENFKPKYMIPKEKRQIITDLKKNAQKADHVLIATDPDREGEAIAWHIKESLQLETNQIERIVFNEITPQAVKNAIANPRQINMDLVNAQQARRILDRLIGYKLSPVLSKKIRKGLSAGRVQSVAAKLVCDREREILSFQPQEYWLIDMDLKKNTDATTLRARLFAKNDEKNKVEIKNQTDAETICAHLKDAAVTVSDIRKHISTRQPAPPFITSSLQQEASRRFFWSTKKTMMIAQQLYEGVEINGESIGLITYMRTDSFRISNEAQTAAKKIIKKKFGASYVPEKFRVFKQKKSAQDAHEAIRPSYLEKAPDQLTDKLSPDHFRLYKLIWDRFMASQMQESKTETTQIIFSAKNQTDAYLLKTSGHQVLFDGFTKLYAESKEPEEQGEIEPALPTTQINDSLTIQDIHSDQKFTQPPARFTEASLIKELEEKGIGRPSTYASTITTIQDRGYVTKENRILKPSELGFLVTDQLHEYFKDYIDVDFTAQMETQLDEIIDGKYDWQEVVHKFYDPLSQLIEHAYTNMKRINTDKPTDKICEKCQHPMVIKTSRYGEFLACSNYPACRNTQSIITELEMPCPECGGILSEKRTKKGKIFYGCKNYPNCKFAAWDQPVAKPCPKCHSPYMLLRKKSQKEKLYCGKCQNNATKSD